MNISKFVMTAAMAVATFGSAFAGNLILVGDSTLAPRTPEMKYGSWGESLTNNLAEGWSIVNCALSGLTVKTIQVKSDKKGWKKALATAQKDDYVIIQFGINDAAKKKLVEIPAFKAELVKFAAAIREKGAKPVFCSPITACKYDKNGKYADTKTRITYGDAAKEVAAEQKIEFIDMTALSGEVLKGLSKEEGQTLFVGKHKNKEGKEAFDGTHPNKKGAAAFAAAFVKDVKARNLDVAKIFK